MSQRVGGRDCVGALHLGLKYPEVFGVIWSVAPALHYAKGTDSAWGSANVKAEAIKRSKMRIRLLCGTEDELLRLSKAFHRLLGQMGIPHDYLEVPGAGHHDLGDRLSDDEVIGFFTEAFKDMTN